jgi:tRNA/rRNA methyltransferase
MPLENIRVVLVRPQGSANIGAAARAMKNMGLRDLVLVGPAPINGFWASAMAVHADDVLGRVRIAPTLAEAVADCGLVVGTTCRDGPYRGAAEPPRSAAPRIVATATTNLVALVFGPEDRGLSNEDLKACHQLLTIPTSADYASLNLAQAVMVCCYEIFLAAQMALPVGAVTAGVETVPPLAPAAKLDLMFRRLRAAFLSIGFLLRDNPDHIMFAFRRMLGRAQLEERDVKILLGLARQIEWFGRSGWRTLAQREAHWTSSEQGGSDEEVSA